MVERTSPGRSSPLEGGVPLSVRIVLQMLSKNSFQLADRIEGVSVRRGCWCRAESRS